MILNMTEFLNIFINKLFPTGMKHFFITLTFFLIAPAVFAQTVISGTVADEEGIPISAATIQLKRSPLGTTTDEKGAFKLEIKQALPVTLTVTFLGYKTQEVDVYEDVPVNITLQEDVHFLDEVVVSAGGISRARREQGYSVTKITSRELTVAKPASLAAGLTAKIPGLQVNAVSSGVNPSYRLVLRGNRSINGDNRALIVVDNSVVSSDFLNNINPETIEDIQVLNGAAGATLYGSEASNGVLLITTKKGTKGRPQITVSHTTTLEQVSFFPKLQDRFGQGTTADAQVFDPIENQQYGPAFDGSIRDLGYPLENGDQQTTTYAAKDDRFKFWETGVQNQTDLSFSFGTNSSTSYISAQYATVTGTTPGDKYNKISVRLNNTQRILPNLNLTYNASFVENNYDITTATESLYEQLLNIPANIPLLQYKDWQNDKWSDPEGWFNPWYRNPYWTAANYRNDAKNTYLTGKAEIKWDITSWLSVLYRVSLSNRYYQSKQFNAKLTLSDYAKSEQGKSEVAGYVYDSQYNTYRTNHDFQIAVSKEFNKYSFNLTLGAANVGKNEKTTTLDASGLVIPGLYNFGNRSGSTSTYTGSSVSAERNYGVWGDLVVGYNKYLFLHVTGRNDWTSLLAKENRSYFYPSVDLSFIPTDAIAALKSSSAINYWKIRGAWSQTGNINIDPYSLQPTYSSSTGWSNGTFFREGSDLVSKDLKPEITTGYEFGTEFRLFKNRIEAEFTYYSTSTTGQAISASIAPSSGYSGYLLNTGEVTNEGVETSLRLYPVRTKDWNLRIGVNYTHNKNLIKSLHPEAKRIGVNGSGVIFAEEGYEVNQIIVADYARDEQGRVIVDINTGYPSTATESVHKGNTSPKHRLGADLSLQWKNLTLSSVFEYRGGYFYAFTGGGTLDFSGAAARTAYYNRERFVFPNSSYLDPATGNYVENTNITISDGGTGFWTQSYARINGNYVYAGDYWKWRELALSYKVPRTLYAKAANVIQDITIGVQGRNLLLWTPKSNEYTDPDYSANGTNNAIGVSNLSTTPPTRYFGATISFTF
jgi:TonB-linked SusC/RagA family outer membrane protein